jgi:preprotein translocase subunit Sec61beta
MVRQKDRIYMPMGTGGLLRFAEEEKVIFKVKPRDVVILTAVIAAAEILLKIFVPL